MSGRLFPDFAVMRASIIMSLILCAHAANAAPQASQPTFMERLTSAEQPLQVTGIALSGPGEAVLSSAVNKARYVLIGEDHLSREIPRFTTALCQMMAPQGLQALAVEIGPEAARIVNDNLRRPDRIDRLSRYMAAHPDAIAFQNGRDESDMAAACAESAGPAFSVWGLDQEFFGAAGSLFEAMIAAKPGPIAKAAIERLMAQDRVDTAAALVSGSPNQLLIYSMTDAQVAQSRAAIVQDGGPRVRQLFDGLAETRAIFLASATGEGDPNGQRARLMKRTLAGYFAAKPTNTGRILFKFGDNHMGKGFSALGQRDLGNFVAERAEGEGTASLHMVVLGGRGVHAFYNGVGRQARQEPFVMSDDKDYAWAGDVLASRPKSASAEDWLVVDLRELRDGPSGDMTVQWRELIRRYDIVVMAPGLTPSMLVGTR